MSSGAANGATEMKRIGGQDVMKFINGIWSGLCAKTGPELWYVSHEARAACGMHMMTDPQDAKRTVIVIFGGAKVHSIYYTPQTGSRLIRGTVLSSMSFFY